MPKPLLLHRPSGLYVRFFVPVDLQARVGSTYLIRSLQGVRADAARLMAAALGYALSQVFERLRREAVPNAKSLLDAALQGVRQGRDYTVELPNGTKISADGSEAEHHRVRETIDDLSKAGAFHLAPASPLAPLKAGLLSERIQVFWGQMKLRERSETSLLDSTFTLKVFLGIVGDKDLTGGTSDDMDRFMEALSHWPANASKKPQYKGLTPKQVVAKARASDDKKLAPRTKEKHLDPLRVFFKNCLDRRLIAYNPCDGLRVTGKAQDEEQTKRPFDENDLQALFDPNHVTPTMLHKHYRIARPTSHSQGSSVLRRHYIQAATLSERAEDIAKICFPALSVKVLKQGFFEPYFRRVRAVEARNLRQIRAEE